MSTNTVAKVLKEQKSNVSVAKTFLDTLKNLSPQETEYFITVLEQDTVKYLRDQDFSKNSLLILFISVTRSHIEPQQCLDLYRSYINNNLAQGTLALIIFSLEIDSSRAFFRLSETVAIRTMEQYGKAISVLKVCFKILQDTYTTITIGKGNVFHGDFVVAKRIQDSFNTIAQSESANELKQLLNDLSVAVSKMIEVLPTEDEQRRASTALKTIIEESTSAKPDYELWQPFVNKLIKLARNMGENGKPTLEILKKLQPILESMSA